MPSRQPGEAYYRMSVDEAKEMLDTDQNAVIVDVRNSDEYHSGHVTGAIWIPVDEILTRVHELPDDKRLLFICAAGARSGLACEMAAAMGLDTERLYNVEDGTPTWIEKNYPTSNGSNP
jgi:rhodanese-related sulfurtransferase